MSETKLADLQAAVEAFVHKAAFTPPWESSGAIWGEMVKQLNNALIDSRETEKRKDEGCICPAVNGEIHTPACPANKYTRR